MRQTIAASADLLGYLERCQAAHGDVFTLRTVPFPAVVAVASHELVGQAMRHPSLLGGEASALVRPVLGDRSVIVESGPSHLAARRMIAPAFHGRQVHAWARQIVDIADDLLMELPDGRHRFVALMQQLVFDVTAKLVLGPRPGQEIAELERAIQRTTQPAFQVQFWLAGLQRDLGPVSPWGRFLRRRAELHRLLDAAIGAAAPGDGTLVGDLLAADVPADVEAAGPWLRDQVLTLLIAGHEATATALAWAAERLAREGQVQLAARRAIADGDARYLEALAHEVLRWAPPVYDAVRTSNDSVTLGDHAIPPGTMVTALLCLSTRDPRVWDHPSRFDPARFLRGDGPVPAQQAFGGGLRRCLGAPMAMMELRAVLAVLLTRIELAARGDGERRRVVGVQQMPRAGASVSTRQLQRRPLSDDQREALAALAVAAARTKLDSGAEQDAVPAA